jgi:hypothetical protein
MDRLEELEAENARLLAANYDERALADRLAMRLKTTQALLEVHYPDVARQVDGGYISLDIAAWEAQHGNRI